MRVLVSIGCDQYVCKEMSDLGGAENDAVAIYDSLLSNGGDLYDKENSILLKSPSWQEAKKTLEKVIFDSNGDVDFCLFFAGHGCVKDGAYYLCVKDSYVDRLSVSAISITELFMWINEANIRDSSILIDACQAGGIAHDVATFLKPFEIGRIGSPSVSILSASAADQVAREVNGQGIATSAILKCLSGDVVVQTERETLSLFEVGQSVSEQMSSENHQVPVYWGLNLFGRPQFSKNHCFHQKNKPEIGLLDELIINADEVPIIRKNAYKVWELYLSSYRCFDTLKFLDLTQTILNELPEDSTSVSVVVDALANTFLPLVTDSNDPYEKVELLGACLTSLLPYADNNELADRTILDFSEKLLKFISSGEKSVLKSLEENQFSLLSDKSALADLYYLPIRILKILGWAGAGQYISNILKVDIQYDIEIRQQLVRKILELYISSIVSVSDEQTCSFVMFLSMLDDMKLSEEGKQIFELLCYTFHKFGGKISRAEISGADAYRFVKERSDEASGIHEGLLAKPTEFLSSLIIASEKLSLSDVVDDFIEDFDHTPINLFVPDSYTRFAAKRIEDGLNNTLIIGHGIWCVNDFISAWASIADQISHDKSLELPSVKISAICASLIRPDRTPWFVLI